MRIVDNTLYVHPQNGGYFQSAQAFTLDGNEIWYMEHDQTNIDESLDEAEVFNAVISSNGDAFGVGKQYAIPFAGRYLFKTSNTGQLEYTEEYFTSSFSSGFNDIKLSADESMLYVFGEKYSATINTIAPHLFKINPSNGAIIAEQEALNAFVLPKKITLDNSDNIYLNASNTDTLKFMSFDNNLNFRWQNTIEVEGFSANAKIQALLYANGDVLFSTIIGNYTDDIDQRLFIARYSSEGNQIWQNTFNMNDFGIAKRFPKDIVLDETGKVYFYFEMVDETNNGPTMPEEANQNDRSEGSTDIGKRPEVFSFDSNGELIYHFLYPGMSESEYREYPNRIIVDENGYLIGSSSGDSPFEGISLFLLSPQGNMISEQRTEIQEGAIVSGMLYAGNKVFYTHGTGTGLQEGDLPQNMVARYSYDYITGFQSERNIPQIGVFPNPSNQGATMMISGLNTVFPMQIYSVDGRLIQDERNISEDFELNTSNLQQGIYILKNGNRQTKFILSN
jgi:outer membrane protein assembly factor BamB